MATAPFDDRTTVRLHTGERLSFSRAEVERVFDELWMLAHRMKGALGAASKLKRVEGWTLLHGDDVLSAEETAALREAVRRTTSRD